MTYKTHVAFALAATIPISNYAYGLNSLESFMFLGAVSLAALAPDLDEEGSYLSKKLPIFPMFFKLFGVKHRGVTHRAISVVFLIFLFLIIGYLDENTRVHLPLYFGFLAGWSFHLAGDMLTKGGINQFFYPFSKTKAVLLPRRYRFYTASMNEFLVFTLLFGIVVIQSMYFTGIINV